MEHTRLSFSVHNYTNYAPDEISVPSAPTEECIREPHESNPNRGEPREGPVQY